MDERVEVEAQDLIDDLIGEAIYAGREAGMHSGRGAGTEELDKAKAALLDYIATLEHNLAAYEKWDPADAILGGEDG